jgi:hypothetical protein
LAGRQFAALARSMNNAERSSAMDKLKRENGEANVLVDPVSDSSLLGWHPDLEIAHARVGRPGPPAAHHQSPPRKQQFFWRPPETIVSS